MVLLLSRMVQTSVYIEQSNKDYFTENCIEASAFIRKAITEKIERDQQKIQAKLNKEINLKLEGHTSIAEYLRSDPRDK